MTHTNPKVRDHYGATGLTARLKSALATLGPEDETLAVTQLAPLDHFHTKGVLATTELGEAAELTPSTRVLDVGSGIGGPARFLAATFGCHVTGVDLSESFVEAANYLTARCGLSERADFQVGDALHLPFPAGAFDTLFLQHVAMNIEDRSALYREISRVLAPGGRFVTYDVVLRDGDVQYPVPWARTPETSFLLSAEQTRQALTQAGFRVSVWRDDTQSALQWFKTSGPPPSGLNLGVVMGPEFQVMAANLALNLREDRIGVLLAVAIKE